LSAVEKEQCAAPYKIIASRKPLRVWPCEIPIIQEDNPPGIGAALVDWYKGLA